MKVRQAHRFKRVSGARGALYSLAAKEESVMVYHCLDIPRERIAEFCRRHHIRKLSLFGSILRDDFRPDSDIDVLVEFEPHARVGLIKLAGIEIELSELLGRKVDLNTPGFLSRYYRDQVLAEAEVQYDAA
jgi:predicted nucleotidyltransferase